MISNIKIKNFMAFEELNIDFSPKINIFIGENSTGKTQLLKACYLSYLKNTKKGDSSKEIADEMNMLFRPIENKISKLYHIGASSDAVINTTFSDNENFYVEFTRTGKLNQSKTKQASWVGDDIKTPVFIPTKEILSLMQGLNALYEKYDLPIDKTLRDLWLHLELPNARDAAISAKSKWAIDTLEKIYGGKFVSNGGGNISFKANKQEYSANTIAEGFRKLGILTRLLETGVLNPGQSGALFWDEPEANLNPKLLKTVVEVLLELARNGQQVIITTHDYVLLKWFNLLADTKKDDHIRFHRLYREEANNKIIHESSDDLSILENSAIFDTFSSLLIHEVSDEMGDLGK